MSNKVRYVSEDEKCLLFFSSSFLFPQRPKRVLSEKNKFLFFNYYLCSRDEKREEKRNETELMLMSLLKNVECWAGA